MPNIQTRLNYNWYAKKIKQNTKIQKHLISIIKDNADSKFPYKLKDLPRLGYEDLLEIAIAMANKKLTITNAIGEDFNNGADAKFSIVRKYNKGKSYAAGVTGCANKKHILCCVYEGIQQKFYYFSFPATLHEHTIPFDRDTGEPKKDNYMWKHNYQSFKDMALSV